MKKNNTNPYARKSKADKKRAKSKKTALIIVAAISALAVCVAAAILIARQIEKSKFGEIDPAVTQGYERLEPNEGDAYTYVNYNGLKMPEEFAQHLNQAAVDSQAACENGGVALIMGGKQISAAEFRMYYYEQAIYQYQYTFYMESQMGTNGTGFDYNVDPAEQNRLREETTWEEHFVNEAIDTLKFTYGEFERACAAGTELSAEQIQKIMDVFSEYASVDFESNYGEGATFAMFCSKHIMETYAAEFYNQETERQAQALSEEEVNAKYNEDPKVYQVVNARIYPIEGGYEEGDAADVKTEEQFLAYAKENYAKLAGEGDFDMDSRTDCWCIGYTTALDTYGEAVAKWLFDDARKPGEITVLTGTLYHCLVYIEDTKYDPYSSDIIYIDIPFEDAANAEAAASDKQKAQQIYDEWKAGKADAESLKAAFEGVGTVEELTARAGEFERSADVWIHDSSRKPGDSNIFFSDSGSYIFFYVSSNPEDFDWISAVRSDVGAEKYTQEYEAYKASEYADVKKNEEVIEALADAANAQCDSYAKSYQQQNAQAAQ